MKLTVIITLTALLLIPAVAHGASTEKIITGYPHIHDADTITIEGKRIRLEGIDAPELKQACESEDRTPYQCGEVSTAALRVKIGTDRVSCNISGRGRYRRYLGICFTNGMEESLNAWLVSQGHAVAYRKYSKKFVPHEEEAMTEGRGIWQGHFISPWEFRKGKREVSRNSNQPVVVKKSGSGICHCSGGRFYERTKKFTSFATIKECLDSGGRPPKNGQGDCK